MERKDCANHGISFILIYTGTNTNLCKNSCFLGVHQCHFNDKVRLSLVQQSNSYFVNFYGYTFYESGSPLFKLKYVTPTLGFGIDLTFITLTSAYRA